MSSPIAFEPNPVPIAFRIEQLANVYGAGIYRDVADSHGVTRAELALLFSLRAVHEPGDRELSEGTRGPTHPKRIDPTASSMLERGYIARSGDPKDPRGLPRLSLTRRGSALCDCVLPLFLAHEQAMLAPLNARDRTALVRILTRLVLLKDG